QEWLRFFAFFGKERGAASTAVSTSFSEKVKNVGRYWEKPSRTPETKPKINHPNLGFELNSH
ncbi:MAG: hypothetical protein R3Y26_11585, partial [Rikenellaceae bacterium]